MQKAQNLIEVSLVLVLVVVVSLALWPMFNNQKTKLAGLSKSNLSTQSISGRQIQLKNDVFDFGKTMGLTVDKNKDSDALLNEIKNKLTELTLAGAPASTIKGYEEKYTALLNEQAAIKALSITVNDNTTIASAQGGRVGTPSASSTSSGGTTSSPPTQRPLPTVAGHNAAGQRTVDAINGNKWQ